MKSRVIRWSIRTAKIVLITIATVLLLMFLLPYIFPGAISAKIKTLVNNSIDGKVEFSKTRLSFFKHFPSLTLSLKDFTSTGAAPFQNKQLLSAGEISFGIDILKLIRGDVHVNEFYISNATINVMVNEKGDANYNVYKSSSTGSGGNADTSTSLQLERVVIENSNLSYDDKASGILIKAQTLNYAGSGDLTKAVFDLTSQLTVDSFDLYFGDMPYVLKKRINASLLTSINTNSLELKFTKNKIRINRLPLELSGQYEFLSRGYKMNFEITSADAKLRSVFTVLPPSYQGWLKKTKIRGNASLTATLKGNYIPGTDSMPDATFDMKIREGSIAYQEAPAPVKNLYLDFRSRLPAFNMDSLSLNIDSIFFNVDKDHFSGVLRTKGYESPYVFSNLQCAMDLQKFDKALGLQDYDLKGNLSAQVNADGVYKKGQLPGRMRREIGTTSIPSFYVKAALRNGYFHYTPLPEAIRDISFDMEAKCPDNDHKNISVSVEHINLRAMENYVKGYVKMKNAGNFSIDADLDAVLNLADVKKVYPLDSLAIGGNVLVKLQAFGNYQPDKNVFPKTNARVEVKNGSVLTKYYPAPIEKIAVNAVIKNSTGSLKDLAVNVQPISLQFEGQPFMVKALLNNFDDLQYDIQSKGALDIGRIYRVFSRDGLDVRGFIETDLSLKGSQQLATSGQYSKLDNRGTLRIKELVVTSELYPLPFLLKQGVFRFDRDHIRFDQLTANYGKTDVELRGSVSNIFNYMSGSGPLQGNVHIQSDYLLLDELMAYHSDNVSPRPDSLPAGSGGVIIIPSDLDLKCTADIEEVDYNALHINDVTGKLLIKNGGISIDTSGFELAGATTVMNASYKSLSPARAVFTSHIKMNEFDVKRMYDEVSLFRELAPAAARAEGIISLEYELAGKLDSDMYPVLPSLKGGGVLSVKNVKLKGLRFFSAVSKQSGKETLKDPDLSKIDFKTSIKNNVVTLEKTRIKVSGFRLRLQGQTSLDGAIKFNCRVGLPPFGIIGIPIRVTGTGERPLVKVGKTDKLPLKETEEEMNDTDSSTTENK